jgi:hypothetical protein
MSHSIFATAIARVAHLSGGFYADRERAQLIRAAIRQCDNCRLDAGFIFIHVPKSAGTYLGQLLGVYDSCHATAREYRWVLGRGQFKRLRLIAVARHPFDRFLSSYHYARLEVSHFHSNRPDVPSRFGKHQDYERLRGATADQAVDYLTAGLLKHDSAWNHWLPQSHWLAGSASNQRIILRYEQLADDVLHYLAAIIPPDDLKHHSGRVNSSVRHNYMLELSTESRAKLRRYYAGDFALFGYKYPDY